MFYVSRYIIHREGRKHRKKFDVFVGDTENDCEGFFSMDELQFLMRYGVKVHGLHFEYKHGDKTLMIGTYTPPTGENAKAKLLYGFSCTVIDGVLKYIAPDSSVRKEDDSLVTVILSALCQSVEDGAVCRSCTCYKIKFVFDDRLTFSTNIFKDLYKRNISWKNLTFDIRDLSDDKAAVFYQQVGFKVEECHIIDEASRKYNLIGHQCYLHCIPPSDPRSYICNRKLQPNEFYNLYKGVGKGVQPVKGYTSNASRASRLCCRDHLEHMVESYEETGGYDTRVSIISQYKALKGITATVKLLESYVTARGNDPVLLEAYYHWAKESLKVL